ncbi:MAG: hypothetical protein ACJ0Q1_00475 [Luminiphilus sp.]
MKIIILLSLLVLFLIKYLKRQYTPFFYAAYRETLVPRGGYRSGAGRPTGSLNKTTSEQSQRLSELAKHYTHDALLTLVDVAKNGRSDAARVSAANALLDRGYGKPGVNEEIEHVDLPPMVIQIKPPDADATE